MVFERPKQPKKPTKPPAPDKPNKPKKVIPRPKSSGSGGGRGGKGGSGGDGGNNRPEIPSPWLDPKHEPEPDRTASFVEYLRWMRSPDHPQKDATKVQILQMAEDNADYRDRLTLLNKRTEAIAGKGNTFQVKCSWRIRVGGHRGPESILLPAFDALGMPYIPASSLRGAARTQAIREFMKRDNLDWKEAEKRVSPYFGSLEAEEGDRAGKVVFLDAYPLPGQVGLAVDMANNIWKWDGNATDYSPNPNPFLSLKEPTFLIGLRLASNCQDPEVLQKVKQWLVAGLQSGVGSQVNTGYGELLTAGAGRPGDEFFRVEFSLEGQLIHGRQKFTQWNWNDRRQEWQMRGQADAEVRPVAFKSMLRYWFRTFALGVLEPGIVKEWEAQLFGAIDPQKLGWVRFDLQDGKVTQREPRSNYKGKDDDCGEQVGTLTLAYSNEAPSDKQKALKTLFENLVWMMFSLGGIGQGARRPCYSRKTRDRAPWYRGSTFYIESDDEIWLIPKSVQGFQNRFQERLQSFYTALSQISGHAINSKNLKTVGRVSRDRWTEAADRNCQIVVCAGQSRFDKPYSLAVLHDNNFKVENRRGQIDYDGNLCGQVQGGVKPSPVWIADLGDYQVVTVFGASADPRQRYLNELRSQTSKQNYARIFPF